MPDPDSSPVSAAAARHDPYAVFRRPLFRRFLLSALLVNIGTAAQSLAIGWEMYQRTDRAMALGLIGLTQAVPMLLFTLPAGYLADVFDRRRVMIAGLVGTTLTSIALAIFSHHQGSIPIMYALLFFDAAFHRLAGPAGAALLPQLVPARLFEAAVKWRTTLFHLAAAVGPALGGAILSQSITAAYLFSAATTTIHIVVLSSLRLPESTRSRRGQMLRQLGEGLDFVWRQKLILGPSPWTWSPCCWAALSTSCPSMPATSSRPAPSAWARNSSSAACARHRPPARLSWP